MPPNNYQAKLERGDRISWRPFPCARCCDGLSPGDFLREGFNTGQNRFCTQLDEQIKLEARLLVEWAESCPHGEIQYLYPPMLAEGSEHSVYLRAESGVVYKVTLPNIFGDWYYLQNEIPFQQGCTPLDYLSRLELWADLFGSAKSDPEGAAPIPIGVSPTGRIVTRQKFIETTPISQKEVEDGLEADGWIPLKKSCYLWRKQISQQLEVRLGDARDENFAIRDGRLIPIDIRLWLVNVMPDTA